MRKLLLLALVLGSLGCGPAFRYRSPDILDARDIEVGAGLGAGGLAAVSWSSVAKAVLGIVASPLVALTVAASLLGVGGASHDRR